LYPASTLLKANVPITSSASTPGTYHLMNLYQLYAPLKVESNINPQLASMTFTDIALMDALRY
jgi:hypothetical protein